MGQGVRRSKRLHDKAIMAGRRPLLRLQTASARNANGGRGENCDIADTPTNRRLLGHAKKAAAPLAATAKTTATTAKAAAATTKTAATPLALTKATATAATPQATKTA